jgi:hypothetical protein
MPAKPIHFTNGVAEYECESSGVSAELTEIWVFNGLGRRGCFPSAVFATRNVAEKWISRVAASGTLTHLNVDPPANQDARRERLSYKDGQQLDPAAASGC